MEFAASIELMRFSNPGLGARGRGTPAGASPPLLELEVVGKVWLWRAGRTGFCRPVGRAEAGQVGLRKVLEGSEVTLSGDWASEVSGEEVVVVVGVEEVVVVGAE